MATYKENNEFAQSVLPNNLLDDAIEWIRSNMRPEEIFSHEDLLEWANEQGMIDQD